MEGHLTDGRRREEEEKRDTKKWSDFNLELCMVKQVEMPRTSETCQDGLTFAAWGWREVG